MTRAIIDGLRNAARNRARLENHAERPEQLVEWKAAELIEKMRRAA